jgi:hypothetical protein
MKKSLIISLIVILGVIFFFPKTRLVGTINPYGNQYIKFHTPKCLGFVGEPRNFIWLDDKQVDYVCYGIIYKQEQSIVDYP